MGFRLGQSFRQAFANAVTCSGYEHGLPGQSSLEFESTVPEQGEKKQLHRAHKIFMRCRSMDQETRCSNERSQQAKADARVPKASEPGQHGYRTQHQGYLNAQLAQVKAVGLFVGVMTLL